MCSCMNIKATLHNHEEKLTPRWEGYWKGSEERYKWNETDFLSQDGRGLLIGAEMVGICWGCAGWGYGA